MNLVAPFQSGATYWRPITAPRRVTVPCPVCAGARSVKVVASEEDFIVDCDACGLGFSGPQGTVEEYHYDPHAEPFKISRMVRFDDDGWSVESTDGRVERFTNLRDTEEEALAVSRAAYAEQEERNAQLRRHRRKGVSKATWTVRYHTDAIKKLERELAYHRRKIGRPSA